MQKKRAFGLKAHDQAHLKSSIRDTNSACMHADPFAVRSKWGIGLEAHDQALFVMLLKSYTNLRFV